MGKTIEIKEPIVYRLHIKMAKILARQDAETDRRKPIKQDIVFGKREETTTSEQTVEQKPTDELIKQPVEKRQRNKSKNRITDVLVHSFTRNNGHITERIGGTFGYLKTTLRRAVKTISFASYKEPSIELIRFDPEIVDLGKDENITDTPVLEPRSRGKTMELVKYETAINREFDINMIVSATCPLTGEELGAILTSIKDYDGFGASRRGIISSIEVKN